MKSDDQNSRNAALVEFLSELANTWSLGRALMEHERAGASPADQPFSEKDVLTLCLVEQFEGMVTATTLCKVFGLHHSQIGKLVNGLVSRDLLKKSTEPISRKSGRGTPFQLTAKAKEALKEIKLRIGAGFEYLYEDFNTDELRQMCEFTRKTQAAAKKRFKRNVFQIFDSKFLKHGN